MKDNYILVVDNFVDYKYLYSFINDNKNENITGIIFRECNFCNKSNYLMNYYSYYSKPEFNTPEITLNNNSVIKEKINISHLKDKNLIMKIVKTKNEDIYDIYYKNHLIDIADVPDLKTSIYLKELFKKYNYSFLYFTCNYNIKNKRWRPIKLNIINK